MRGMILNRSSTLADSIDRIYLNHSFHDHDHEYIQCTFCFGACHREISDTIWNNGVTSTVLYSSEASTEYITPILSLQLNLGPVCGVNKIADYPLKTGKG